MQLVRSGAAGSAALELAVSHALLTRVAAGELPPTLRVYRPAPAVAFGKLDTLRPGLPRPRSRPPARTATSRSCGCPAATPRPTTRTRSRSTSCGRSTIPSSAPTTASATRASGWRARCGSLGRRRARGGGAGRVLPGRLLGQRARAREADRHRPAARPRRRRCSAPRSSSATARACAPCSTTSTPRSSSTGTRRPRARSTRRSPGVTLDAVERAVIAAFGELEPAALDEADARARAPRSRRSGHRHDAKRPTLSALGSAEA